MSGTTTVRELRNHGGEVIDRVLAGESLTVTRDGTPVAELRPLSRRPHSATVIVEHFRRLPRLDPVAFRADIDAIVDQSL
jgi:prevent-host-death family protein